QSRSASDFIQTRNRLDCESDPTPVQGCTGADGCFCCHPSEGNGAAGEPCGGMRDAPCDTGLSCIDGTCHPGGDTGDPCCGEGQTCAQGHCCVGGQCAPAGGPGQWCCHDSGAVPCGHGLRCNARDSCEAIPQACGR